MVAKTGNIFISETTTVRMEISTTIIFDRNMAAKTGNAYISGTVTDKIEILTALVFLPR